MKKFLAFIIDIIILICFILFFSFIFLIILSPLIDEETYRIAGLIIEISLFIIYVVIIPKILKGPPGWKIMQIKELYRPLIYISPLLWWVDKKSNNFTQGHLKKEEILKVAVKNGRWICPSCNEPNLEIYDVCSNCGQEISKSETH